MQLGKNTFLKILISVSVKSVFPHRLLEKLLSEIEHALAHSELESFLRASSASKLGYILPPL